MPMLPLDDYWLNPQYWLEVGSPAEGLEGSTVIISIMQKYTRRRKTVEQREHTEEAVGFDIHRVRYTTLYSSMIYRQVLIYTGILLDRVA